MNVKNLNLVYFSATQTTQKVATAFAKGFNANETKVYDFTLPQGRQNVPSFTKDDVVLIGIPVYVGRVPSFLMNYLRSLKGDNTPCVLIAVYGNRNYDSCLVELEDIVRENGFLPMAGGAFIGTHSFSDEIAKNRPSADELVIAENFGKDVFAKLAKMEKAEALPLGAIGGARPYFVPPVSAPRIAPIVKDTCINCGLCAKKCPMGAINPENVKDIDPDKCIKCRRCARICPVGAIDLSQPPFQENIAKLTKAFGNAVKAPELFL